MTFWKKIKISLLRQSGEDTFKKVSSSEIRKAIEAGKIVFIRTKKINVCYTLAPRPEDRKGVQFDSMFGSGLIVVSKSEVVVYQMIDDTGGKEQMKGTVEVIEYDSFGNISEIIGIARNWVDNEFVRFKLVRGLENIRTYKKGNIDNYFCEFEQTVATPNFRIAYLLQNTEEIEVKDPHKY